MARDLKETGGTEARPVPAPASPGPAPPAAAVRTQEHRGPALPHTAAPPPVPSCRRQPRLGSALLCPRLLLALAAASSAPGLRPVPASLGVALRCECWAPVRG